MERVRQRPLDCANSLRDPIWLEHGYSIREEPPLSLLQGATANFPQISLISYLAESYLYDTPFPQTYSTLLTTTQ